MLFGKHEQNSVCTYWPSVPARLLPCHHTRHSLADSRRGGNDPSSRAPDATVHPIALERRCAHATGRPGSDRCTAKTAAINAPYSSLSAPSYDTYVMVGYGVFPRFCEFAALFCAENGPRQTTCQANPRNGATFSAQIYGSGIALAIGQEDTADGNLQIHGPGDADDGVE